MTTVRAIMTPAPLTIGAEQTVAEARHRMRAHRVRHLPVLAGAHVVGMLSDNDLRLVDAVAGSEKLEVAEIMSPETFVVNADDGLKHVVEQMATRKIGSAVVVEHAKVVGIFTTTDALHLLLRHLDIDSLRGF